MNTIPRKTIMPCVAALLATALFACDSPESVEVTESQPEQPTPQSPASSSSEDGITLDATITIEGVTLGIPERWMPAEGGSQFTAVQYTIPGSDPSKNATLTVSNPIGGGLIYNTLRWDRQFPSDDADIQSWVVLFNDLQIMEFEGRGTYDSGLPGSPGLQENMVVLGAVPIVNGPEQFELAEPDENGRHDFTIDQEAQPLRFSNIFIKLTGPAETVDAAREEWDAMLESIRIGDVSMWATP